jgi:DNA-binding MarR family transcriptional regulator
LTEVRILHELAHDRAHTAADLSRNLGLDTGYLSRLITNFQKLGLVVRRKNESDGRAHLLTMTPEAKAKVDELDLHVSAETASLLDSLAPGEIEQLSLAMADIERLLSPASHNAATRLRSPRCGDFGWMIERHAHLDVSDRASLAYEAHAAKVVSRFLGAMQTNTPRIACWVAEQEGDARVGAALLTAASDGQACIELLFVSRARAVGVSANNSSPRVRTSLRARATKASCAGWTRRAKICAGFSCAPASRRNRAWTQASSGSASCGASTQTKARK